MSEFMRVGPALFPAGRPTTVDQIVVKQVTEETSPPSEQCVRLSIVDDILFVSIVGLDETHDSTTQHTERTLMFDLDSFGDALSLLVRDRDRSKVREKVPK